MLTEQRYEIILGLLREKNSVTVTELKEYPEMHRNPRFAEISQHLQGRKTDQGFWRRSGTGAYSQCL